ncbi:hypothetical protein D3C72_1389190 [compost metagenome]
MKPEMIRPMAAQAKVTVFRKPMSEALSPHCSRSIGPTMPTAFCSKASNRQPMRIRKMIVWCERVTPMVSSARSSSATRGESGPEESAGPAMEKPLEKE